MVIIIFGMCAVMFYNSSVEKYFLTFTSIGLDCITIMFVYCSPLLQRMILLHLRSLTVRIGTRFEITANESPQT